MNLLFISNTFPIPPREANEANFQSYMEYFTAQGNSVSFACVMSSNSPCLGEQQRIKNAPAWLKRVYSVEAKRPSAIRRIAEEIFIVRPQYYAWDYDDEALRKIFAGDPFDAVICTPAGMGSFCDAYKRAVSAETKCILSTCDAIYYSYFEQGTNPFVGRERFGTTAILRLLRAPFILLNERKYLKRFNAVHVQTDLEKKRLWRILGNSPRPYIFTASMGAEDEFFNIPYTGAASMNVLFLAQFGCGRERQILWFVKKVWMEIYKRCPEAKLVLVGTPPPPVVAKYFETIPGLIQRGFITSFSDAFQNVALSVVPIRHTGGRIHRLVKSLAAGIPVVCSPQAAKTLDAFQTGVHGIIARDAREFVDVISSLLRDPVRLTNLSKQGRDFAKKHCSWEAPFHAYEQAFSRLYRHFIKV